ncbi:hypothetical protein HAX54_035692, partial [Datura stramonium]|nr:hypothetical protein [Datura stramonium]
KQEAKVDKEIGQVWCSAMEAVSCYHRGSILPRRNFYLISSGGARWNSVTEPKIRVYLRPTLKIITWKLRSSESPRQGRGTELMLRDTLRSTLPVIPGKFITCINSTLRFYFKVSDILSKNVDSVQLVSHLHASARGRTSSKMAK